jgi:hypothetical protein
VKSAGEAAEALFFITSAGLRGQEAIDVLERSLMALPLASVKCRPLLTSPRLL